MKKIKVHSLTGRITLPLMRQAFQAVKRNRGAAGVDRVSIQMFAANLEENLAATSFSTCRWMFQKLDSWIRMRMRAMKLKRKNYHDNYKLRAAYFCRQLGLLTLEEFCTYRDPHGQARRVIPRTGQLRLGSPGA